MLCRHDCLLDDFGATLGDSGFYRNTGLYIDSVGTKITAIQEASRTNIRFLRATLEPRCTPKTGTRPDWLNNITSVFGYDQNDPRQSCFSVFLANWSNYALPFSFGASTIAERGSSVASRMAYNKALKYAATMPRGPYGNILKSFEFKRLMSASSALEEAAPILGIVTAEAQGFVAEMKAMNSGACQ